MSGYSDDAIVHSGVLEAGTHFLAKPFTVAGLTRKVREVLDSHVGSGDGARAAGLGRGPPAPEQLALRRCGSQGRPAATVSARMSFQVAGGHRAWP